MAASPTPCTHKIGNAKSDVPGAARNIQRFPAWLRIKPFHHRILPDAVDAGAHQVVHQVVARRDRGEYLAHKAFLVGFRHLAESRNWRFSLLHGGNIAGSGAWRLPLRPRDHLRRKCMPELPEVETVRLGLLPAMEGHTMTHAETRRSDLRVPFPRDFAARLKGRKVTHLRRRAKVSAGRSGFWRDPGDPSRACRAA